MTYYTTLLGDTIHITKVARALSHATADPNKILDASM